MTMANSIAQRIFRMVRRPLVLVLLVVAIIFLLQKIQWLPSFKDLFKSQPVLIENTPLVIQEIKSIAQLYTAQLYAEVVADSTILYTTGIANTTIRALGLPGFPVPESKKLVLIVKGKVIAGVDLQKLDSSRVQTFGDSIAIQLPPAKIIDILTNPSDIETFIEEGTWTEAERTAVKNKARNILQAEALRQNLTNKANDQARLVLEDFLRLSGFSKINLSFKP
jgi:Protein of unknown function (DUF4230)